MYIDFSGNYTVQENLAQAEIKNLRSAAAILRGAKEACAAARAAGESGNGRAVEALLKELSQRIQELESAAGEVDALATMMENALAKYEDIDRRARAEIARREAERTRQEAERANQGAEQAGLTADQGQPTAAIGAGLLGLLGK